MRYVSIPAIICLVFIAIFMISSMRSPALPLDDEQQALDEQLVIKLSHVVAEHTPKGQAAKHFAQLVHEKSNGQITVQVFANSLLYNDDDELEALLNNEVQMIMPTVSKMTKYVPAWALLDLPYLFEHHIEVERYFKSEAARSLMAESSSLHVHTAAFWYNGFKQLLSVSPITSIDDIANERARIMDSETLAKQFEQLYAKPVIWDFEDVYYGTQQQAYTMQENTFSNIYSKRLYEYQTHMTLSNHGILSYAVLFNDSFYQSLPQHARNILDEALLETTAWHFENSRHLNDDAKQQLASLVQIHALSPAQQRQLRKQIEPLYEAYAATGYASYLEQLQR